MGRAELVNVPNGFQSRLAALKRRLTPGRSLSQRAAYGVVWAFALRLADRLLGLASMAVLARLLGPRDFGLFGIALLAISVLNTFSETGFETALIQKKEGTERFLDTAWTVHVSRGIVLALVLFGVAPYVAGFFDEPRAIWLIRALGLAVALEGLENIGIVYFKKELDLHKHFAYQVSGTLANACIAVLAAIILRNTWALAFGLLGQRLVRTAASYALHPYRPRFRIVWRDVKDLFSFGKWILVSQILHFILTEGDDVFVGKILGAAALGLYQMAYRISGLVATEFGEVIEQVTVPAYSKLQDRPTQLREAYIQTQKLLSYISAPMAGGILILAPDIVQVFLGEQWMSMVPALQALAIWGFVRGVGSNFGPLVTAIGKPELGTWLNVGQLTVIAVLIYPATQLWGILGTAVAIVAVTVLVAPLYFIMALRIIRCKTWELLKQVALPMLAAGIMMLTVEAPRRLWLDHVGIVALFVLVAVGALSYLGMTLFVDRVWGYGVIPLFRRYVGKLGTG
jgi:lipopolysaccharide exporter